MATTEDRRGLDATAQWRRGLYDAKPERQGVLFSTISGLETEPLYTPDNVAIDYERELGYPGLASRSSASGRCAHAATPAPPSRRSRPSGRRPRART